MKNRILGLHDGHSASAALLEDGRVIAAVQEERLSRIKNQAGMPNQAIKDLWPSAGLTASPADRVALAGKYMTYDHWERETLLKNFEESGGFITQSKQSLKDTFIDDFYQKFKGQERKQALAQIGYTNGIVSTVVHHAAHGAAAYYGSGWKGKVLVLTCDGGGDRASATVSIGENGQLRRIASMHENDSIGRLYSMVTYYLGMHPLEHEYKVMGLAPYVGSIEKASEEASIFADLFEFSPKQPMVWQRRKGVPPMCSAYELIRRILYRRRFDLVAAGLQQFVETMLTQWVRNCVRETGIGRVACGGGVFMNVKANKEILALPEVEELFVFPSCGDETNSIGAAYWIRAQERLASGMPVDIEPLGSIYWGRDISDSDVEAALKAYGGKSRIQYKYVPDIEKIAAETLAEGHVVARAKGRMEFGARSLGNRAILARPDRPDVVRRINEMIKNRDFWMPFAPAVLAERADEYYIKDKPMPAPYMIIAFDTRPEHRAKFPAAQHPYDFSVRPQEVSESTNSDFYRLLKYYEELTGEGIMLNTSFNLHGYPIVYQPAEALDVFDRSGLEYLALGNWWVWKS
jgi:carbamoyltransferase